MYLIWCWCFLQIKLLHFWHLSFNLLFIFSHSIFYVLEPTIPSTHLKHRPDFVWAFSTSGFRETSLTPRTHRILLIIWICWWTECRCPQGWSFYLIGMHSRAIFRFYPCRMTCWQQIYNINSTFCVFIYWMHLRLLPLIFCYFYILVHGWQDNHIFLAWFSLLDVGDQHDLFLLVIHM